MPFIFPKNIYVGAENQKKLIPARILSEKIFNQLIDNNLQNTHYKKPASGS